MVVTEIVVGHIETMGSLAKPLVVAKCIVSNGYGSAPHSETVGCFVESLVEVECPISDDSHAEKPLITLVKEETKGIS